jgi:hypothetical protein
MGTTALVLLHFVTRGRKHIHFRQGSVRFGIPDDEQRSETELQYKIPFSEPLITGRLQVLKTKVFGRMTYLMLRKEDHPDSKVTYKITRRWTLEKEFVILAPVPCQRRAAYYNRCCDFELRHSRKPFVTFQIIGLIQTRILKQKWRTQFTFNVQ